MIANRVSKKCKLVWMQEAKVYFVMNSHELVATGY